MSSPNPFFKAIASFFKSPAPSPDILEEPDVQEAIVAVETEADGTADDVPPVEIRPETRPRDVQVASIENGTTVLRSRTW
ncbi:MAG TPA: hypothetical protein V6C98_17935, partial [Thermosynechococcaceae cyanobacterium]